jgi:triacylglycerol lipase
MIGRITRLLLLFELGCAALIASAFVHRYQFSLPMAIATGALIIIAARCLILLYGFAVNYPYRMRQPTMPRLGALKFVHMAATECAIALWSTSWGMPFRRFDKRISPASTTLPVLLLHGYVCNSGFWRPMSRLLRKNNISHYAIDIAPAFGSIDASAAAVHAAVERIVAECGQEQVIIIAHSMGGLVARAYLRDYGIRRTAKVITLGTPHHGTTVAQRGIGINCKEMLCTTENNKITASDWLQKLAVCENKATRDLFISIYSTHDNVIYPQSSSYLEGANNIAVSGIGHMSLCIDRGIGQRIVDEINSIPLQAT